MTKTPEITKKQEQIISLIFRFRFLNRIQIQKFLNHKDYKTINEWLKDLTEKEYIERSYKTTFPDKLKPAVYHIAKNGISFIKSQNENNTKLAQKLYREKDRTSSFADSCQLLADIFLDLQNRTNENISFKMTVKNDYPNHPLEELLSEIRPHAYIEQKAKDKTKLYFLEMFINMPTERIRWRIKKYLSFYQSNEWEGETRNPYPTILIVCPDNNILAYVKRYTKPKFNQLDEPEFAIHLTTADKVKESGITGDIWKAV